MLDSAHGSLRVLTLAICCAELLRFRSYFVHHLHHFYQRHQDATYMHQEFCAHPERVTQAGMFANCEQVWETVSTAWPEMEAFTEASLQMWAEARRSFQTGIFDMAWHCGFLGALGLVILLSAWSGLRALASIYAHRARDRKEKNAYSEAAEDRMRISLPIVIPPDIDLGDEMPTSWQK